MDSEMQAWANLAFILGLARRIVIVHPDNYEAALRSFDQGDPEITARYELRADELVDRNEAVILQVDAEHPPLKGAPWSIVCSSCGARDEMDGDKCGGCGERA